MYAHGNYGMPSRDQVENNPIILYMKGSPNQPQCGFSARTSQALMAVVSASPTWMCSVIPKFAPICRPTPTGRRFPNCGAR